MAREIDPLTSNKANHHQCHQQDKCLNPGAREHEFCCCRWRCLFWLLFFRWLLLYLKSPGVRCIFQDLQDRTQKCCAVQVRL